jgi:LysM repeat protein
MQTLLDIPYRSQRDTLTAGFSINDCGPACVAMLIAATGTEVTTDQVYKDAGITSRGPLAVTTIQRAGNLYNLNLERHDRSSDATLEELRTWIDQGRPAIVLIDYRPAMRAGYHETAINGGHFAVVVGYDDDHIFVHDPYWRGEGGANRRWRTEVFIECWFREWSTYQQIAVVPATAISTVTDPPYPVPPDVAKRIRAKAIFESSPAPHVRTEEDYEEALLWLDDWGEDTQTHVVSPGETMGAIAEQYYGSAQHYRTIAVFNGILNPRLVQVGQELLIPLPAPVPAPGETIDKTREISEPTAATPSKPKTPTEETPVAPPKIKEPEEPAPKPKTYPYTNQQVINAFYEVFSARGERDRFWEYVVAAGLAHLAEYRSERYRGPDIMELPNLEKDVKADILRELGG